ncbi:hypothetical protein TKK_0001802 [Trichogramma kaykai]|uniref:Uncharacterized protein n=1 Tax=Trichogramma kaykai TaxID=54128 RepID=A0ABD2XFD5_9HYME
MKATFIFSVLAIAYGVQARAVIENILEDDVETRMWPGLTMQDVINYIDSSLRPPLNTILNETETIFKKIDNATASAMSNNSNFVSEVMTILDGSQKVRATAEKKKVDIFDCDMSEAEVFERALKLSEEAKKCVQNKSNKLKENANKIRKGAVEALDRITSNTEKAKDCADKATVLNFAATVRCYIQAKADSDLAWFGAPGQAAVTALNKDLELFPADAKSCQSSSESSKIKLEADSVVREVVKCIMTKIVASE